MTPPPSGRLVAAVTGASRGIGRATAWELAARGYQVFSLARSERDLQSLAEQADGEGLSVTPVSMDIAEDRSRQRAVDRLMDETGGYGMDVLVNNAGYGQLGPMEEISAEKLRRQLEVNLVGLLAFTQPFLPGMRDRRRGWVVNVSSSAGRISTPFMGAYSASKFALEAMSDALRLELAPFGVHVVLIEPGPIRTDFSEVAAGHTEILVDSPYRPFLQRYQATKEGVLGVFRRPPEAVARVIVRAVESPHPRPRYTVTVPARAGALARRLVPDTVLDLALRNGTGLTSRNLERREGNQGR